MVWEERFFAEPKDIISVRLTCQCESLITIPIGQKDYVPEVCPYCHNAWFLRGSNDLQMVQQLLRILAVLKDRKPKEAQCQIHIELPGNVNAPDK